MEELAVDGLQLGHRVGQPHPVDAAGVEGDHLVEGALVHRVDGGDPEARGEDAVERCRRPAPLHVPEDRHARLEPRALLDLLGDDVADAAEAHVAELVDVA